MAVIGNAQAPLRGLVALVAGGGSGIGAATAVALARQGASLIVADMREPAAAGTADMIRAEGAEAISCAVNVTDQGQIDAMLDAVRGGRGRLDIVVNSAGHIAPGALTDYPLDEWRASFEINVVGALMLARSCLPLLRASPSAAIVHVSSLAGSRSYPNGGPYGPSKAALVAMSRQMALEWIEHGVRVNAVSPGTIDTPLMRSNMRPEIIEARKQKIPMGRLGTSEDVASLIAFLASPAASYITGENIFCDGGLAQSLMSQRFYANA